MMNVASPLLAAENSQTVPFPDSKLRKEKVKTADQLKYRSDDCDDIGHACNHVVAKTVVIVTVFNIAVVQQCCEKVF